MTQVAEPSTTEPSTTGSATTEPATGADRAGSRLRRPPTRAWIAALAVAMAVAGGVGWWQAHRISSAPGATNRALVDAVATSEVDGQIGTGLSRIFTFDYRHPDATRAAADELLRGTARDQYDQLFSALVDLAPRQQLSTTAQVRASAVEELTGDTARVLVFLDQTSTRSRDGQRSVGAAQVEVTAHYEDGAWRVTDLDLG